MHYHLRTRGGAYFVEATSDPIDVDGVPNETLLYANLSSLQLAMTKASQHAVALARSLRIRRFTISVSLPSPTAALEKGPQ